MDVRRTRGRSTISASEPPPAPRARSPARKSPARKSPARRSPARKSPRKSPARKSPVRKSPSRRSPARTKSPTTTQKERDPSAGRATRKKPTATVPPTSPTSKDSVTNAAKETKERVIVEKKTPPTLITVTRTPISISPLKRDLKESSSIQSVTSSSYSSSTRTTTTIKSKASIETVDFGQNQSGSDRSAGDLEVSKLTSIAAFIRRSVSKNPTPTPTTELSRHSRSVSRSVYEEDDNYSKTEYSDNEEEKYETIRADVTQNSFTKKSLSRQLEVPKDFGGAIGAALFLLLVPPIVLYLQYSCNTQVCRFKTVNLLNTTVASVSNLFDRYVAGAYISFLILVHLLSSFPFGRVVIIPNDRGTVKYYFNSILASLVIVIGLGVAQYLGHPIGSFIWKNYFKLLIVSILTALNLALCCYIRARKAPPTALNPYAKSGNFITDLFLGREITPKWFGVVDIKLACYRTSIIATFIFSLLLITRSVHLPQIPSQEPSLTFVEAAKQYIANIRYDPAALFSATLLELYTLDLIFNEHHLASSFDLQQEGVGALLLLRYAVTPFLMGIVPRYILLNKPISIPLWGYGLISVLFLAGLIIKRASSAIKYQYRMNSQQINLLLIDTVPTFQGRRLLLDKWWGSVRQPNYAGDILSLLAYCAPVAWSFAWPPVLSILLILVFLIHRAFRVNARNYRRYDSPWARYCSRVRYLLVPKVF